MHTLCQRHQQRPSHLAATQFQTSRGISAHPPTAAQRTEADDQFRWSRLEHDLTTTISGLLMWNNRGRYSGAAVSSMSKR